MRKVLLIIVLIIICFFLYGRYINPNGLKTEEYTIKSNYLSDSFDSFKIVHFSDLLFDSYTDDNMLDNITKSINELKPDIIIFTGDLVNSSYKIDNEQKQKIIDSLKRLKPNLYKYAVIGDKDKKRLSQYENIIERSDFILLDNDYEYLFYKDVDPIKIIGITDTSYNSDILSDEEGITPQYKIALTHYSDNYEKLKKDGFDLVLAGNSLGGQVRLPFIGGLIRNEGSKKYIDSNSTDKLSKLYVSNGIGCLKYHFRTFNSPTINLYRLDTKDNSK